MNLTDIETNAQLHGTGAPVFPIDALPDWLGEWVVAWSRHLGVSPEMPAGIGLGVVAHILQRGPVVVDDIWDQPLCLWVMVMKRPGADSEAVLRSATSGLSWPFLRDANKTTLRRHLAANDGNGSILDSSAAFLLRQRRTGRRGVSIPLRHAFTGELSLDSLDGPCRVGKPSLESFDGPCRVNFVQVGEMDRPGRWIGMDYPCGSFLSSRMLILTPSFERAIYPMSNQPGALDSAIACFGEKLRWLEEQVRNSPSGGRITISNEAQQAVWERERDIEPSRLHDNPINLESDSWAHHAVIPRLAAILHILDHGVQYAEIGAGTMHRALRIAEAARTQKRQVLEQIG